MIRDCCRLCGSYCAETPSKGWCSFRCHSVSPSKEACCEFDQNPQICRAVTEAVA